DFAVGILQVGINAFFKAQLLCGNFESRFRRFVNVQLILNGYRHSHPSTIKLSIRAGLEAAQELGPGLANPKPELATRSQAIACHSVAPQVKSTSPSQSASVDLNI